MNVETLERVDLTSLKILILILKNKRVISNHCW